MRNKLIAGGKYTDAMDEVLMKIIEANQKQFKVVSKEAWVYGKAYLWWKKRALVWASGDYYIPCLKLPDEKQQPVGLWGQRHLRYIKQHRKLLYTNPLTSGNLNGYLVDIYNQAEEMFFRLIKQIAEREGVTETLKADNQMEWVSRMNNIRSRATEIVNNDLIYTF